MVGYGGKKKETQRNTENIHLERQVWFAMVAKKKKSRES